jgi:CheY-like chemotaxis protein
MKLNALFPYADKGELRKWMIRLFSMAKILVVDDSPTVLAIASAMLLEAGHEVVTSASAQSALKMLVDGDSIDIILTDIEMPVMDGFEFIREIRRHSPRTPVIAMSGATGGSTLLRLGKQGGACCTLKKPFTQPEITQAVATAIDASSRLKQKLGIGR